MYNVQQTQKFSQWLTKLKDMRARIAIVRRIERAQSGNLGDVKSVGESVYEMRIDMGPGYRLYYTMRGDEMIILLVGGDKSTQQRDIDKSIEMAKEI
ncbi:type II toxin-antitoxin system RelE/ParE family toxin [Sulfuricurvum sp.]|uniref:type II toxin-antitoxin system RelE/ParE family toxin n=1 Tax=Sulfuricurvum sp. TaxID=2025608 RepID=UPI0035654F40